MINVHEHVAAVIQETVLTDVQHQKLLYEDDFECSTRRDTWFGGMSNVQKKA